MPTIPMRREELVDQRPTRMDVSKGMLMPAEVPKPKAEWHPIAKRLFESLSKSGQVHWFQESDWAVAYSLCDDLSRYKRQEDAAERTRRIAEDWDKTAGPLSEAERVERGYPVSRPRVASYGSAAKMDVIYRQLQRLLVTEADRRQARIELEAPQLEVEDAAVVQMSRYRAALESA